MTDERCVTFSRIFIYRRLIDMMIVTINVILKNRDYQEAIEILTKNRR